MKYNKIITSKSGLSKVAIETKGLREFVIKIMYKRKLYKEREEAKSRLQGRKK
jgi:hypothetical protein